MTDTCKENAVNFLMYSYFGYDWKENPYYCAIDRAYNDATLRAALVLKNDFKNNTGITNKEEYDKLYNETEKFRSWIRLKLKAIGTEVIRRYISLIASDPDSEKFILKDNISIDKYLKKFHDPFECDCQEDYDIWHRAVCKSLVEYYDKQYAFLLADATALSDSLPKNHDKEYAKALAKKAKKLSEMEEGHQQYFSYGNAQKWVNMTMKNLYIISIMKRWLSGGEDQDTCSEGKDNHGLPWNERIINCSKYFHIPLDSYMFDAIKNKSNGSIKPEFHTNNKKEPTSSWSKIDDYDEYVDYQQKVNEKIKSCTNPIEYPIDWEGSKWLEEAKKVKAHDKKREWESCYKEGTYPTYPH
ncbi:MAG: hypothetical protein LUF32_08325 [Clostridiales bacterium]|nr:hypothetical protein [Clostridiales bacterium]